MRLFSTPRYRNVKELLDEAGNASELEIRHTLRDIRRANIFGIGTWVVKHHLARMIRRCPRQTTFDILDLATGSADIPQALSKWAQESGYRFRIVATDISPEILAVARRRIERAGLEGNIRLAACDATRPPFESKSFDFVICSLAMHHLELGQARCLLRQMALLSRRGFIVNDIYRSQGAWLMAWILVHFTTTNRLTRHDGPASVYRAFTPLELARLAREAGVNARIYRHPFWRMAAVWHDAGDA